MRTILLISISDFDRHPEILITSYDRYVSIVNIVTMYHVGE